VEREPLKERVEVDETYLGGPEAGLKGGRQLLGSESTRAGRDEMPMLTSPRIRSSC
jgi:hypothetical protein